MYYRRETSTFVLFEEPMIPERHLRENRGLESVQKIEEFQLIVLIPAGNQQAREIVFAQAHLRRFRYFWQTIRNWGWHAAWRGLI